VDAPEEASGPPLFVLGVEKVVQDLAYRGDGVAPRYGRLEQGPHPKLSRRRLPAREIDHGPEDVDPEHPRSTTRPSGTSFSLSISRMPGVAGVVDVGGVFLVEVGHAGSRWPP